MHAHQASIQLLCDGSTEWETSTGNAISRLHAEYVMEKHCLQPYDMDNRVWCLVCGDKTASGAWCVNRGDGLVLTQHKWTDRMGPGGVVPLLPPCACGVLPRLILTCIKGMLTVNLCYICSTEACVSKWMTSHMPGQHASAFPWQSLRLRAVAMYASKATI